MLTFETQACRPKRIDVIEAACRAEVEADWGPNALRLVAPCPEAQASLERYLEDCSACGCSECQDPCLPPGACA